jgi:hypothetical protein
MCTEGIYTNKHHDILLFYEVFGHFRPSIFCGQLNMARKGTQINTHTQMLVQDSGTL